MQVTPKLQHFPKGLALLCQPVVIYWLLGKDLWCSLGQVSSMKVDPKDEGWEPTPSWWEIKFIIPRRDRLEQHSAASTLPGLSVELLTLHFSSYCLGQESYNPNIYDKRLVWIWPLSHYLRWPREDCWLPTQKHLMSSSALEEFGCWPQKSTLAILKERNLFFRMMRDSQNHRSAIMQRLVPTPPPSTQLCLESKIIQEGPVS